MPAQYSTINQALDSSTPGDVILVAPGTYSEAEVRTVNFVGIPVEAASLAFLKEGVIIRSEAGPELTTLDLLGQGGPQGVGFVVVANHLSLETTLEGFTITGPPSFSYATITHDCSDMRYINCIFRDLDTRGQGAAGAAGRDQESNVQYVGCRFLRCAADAGGAVFHGHGSLTIEECLFDQCINNGLNVYTCLNSQPVSVRNTIFQNTTNDGPAGPSLTAADVANLLVESCAFVDNVGTEQTSALTTVRCKSTIRHNFFLRNNSSGLTSAGAVSIGGFSLGPVIIEQNTFYECSKAVSGAASASALFIIRDGDFPQYLVRNNVFSDCPGASAVYVYSGNVTTSCNVFWQNPDGDMNIALDATDRVIDPQFCDPDVGDLTVMDTSPCLPENSFGCGLIGAFGNGCGTISIEAMTWGRIKNLYRGSDESRGVTP